MLHQLVSVNRGPPCGDIRRTFQILNQMANLEEALLVKLPCL